MLSAQDLRMRRSGVTATDATIIAGVSPYGRTVHDIYMHKVTDDAEQPHISDAMMLGHKLEPIALESLANAKELWLGAGHTERHPILEWVIATPDADVFDRREHPKAVRVGVAEAKAVGLRMAHRWGEDGDEIPDEVRVQVQWQMITTRTKLAHVVALIGTEARFFEIEHDEDLSTALLELCDNFWRKHVVALVPPDIDGSDGAANMVRSLFRHNRGGIVRAPAEAEALAMEYLRASEAETEASIRKKAAQTRLCAFVGDADGIDGETWSATWKETASGGTDWKALAEKLGATPDVTKQYARPGARRFLMRLKKGAVAA